MPVLQFPDPRDSPGDDIVAIGGDLHPETLQLAYRSGIFPWPHRGLPLLWFSPDPRAVLDFDKLHVPERLARKKRNTKLAFTIDKAFPEVIAACQSIPRAGQPGTWITAPLRRSYERLHTLGDAHSVEAWDETGALVGGLYGVSAGGFFSGESMFHRVSAASKLCVLHLIEHFQAREITWLDVQTMTPHFEALGAIDISRDEFLDRVEEAQRVSVSLF